MYFTKSPEETINLGERLGFGLNKGDTVLLFGELGSGKTHFTKGIAKGLNINETIKSPTFAYVNKYAIEGLSKGYRRAIDESSKAHQKPIKGPSTSFFHYDLYRLNPGDDLSSIGFDETIEDDKAINVVEWADRIVLLPKKYIQVEFESLDEIHKISIKFIDPEVVPKEKIEEFYEEWSTPIHVRNHIKQVTNVAMTIADKFIEKGEIINLNLLYSGAMMHDIARVCDFRKLEESNFIEEITKEKWNKWEDLRKTHQGFHHADIARKFFNEVGYPKTAEIIYTHKSKVIATEPELLNSLERKFLFYADKRVKHDEIVPLKERFRDGWERYGKFDDKLTRQLFDEVEVRTFELEKELFDVLEISPDEL
ncbi:tRNA (adenosine(37)-N6)-threonylcarbamoyltransferase complex ATPase subunit type 1 TsaE [Candidatus Peregrinibacteria bacterium]|nr:tRNA (adenosine(37)-N6)-threonylcarbamoyltransferase complex ATPase subunit type 1 TsaE [Candidatus Peregrinibacteria bacterium]